VAQDNIFGSTLSSFKNDTQIQFDIDKTWEWIFGENFGKILGKLWEDLNKTLRR